MYAIANSPPGRNGDTMFARQEAELFVNEQIYLFSNAVTVEERERMIDEVHALRREPTNDEWLNIVMIPIQYVIIITRHYYGPSNKARLYGEPGEQYTTYTTRDAALRAAECLDDTPYASAHNESYRPTHSVWRADSRRVRAMIAREQWSK